MRKTISFEVIGNCGVLVHGRVDPTDEEWDRYIRFLQTHGNPHSKVVVYTHGGTPTAKQRAKLIEYMERAGTKDVPVAVMTSSPVARGVVTVFRWLLHKNMAAFSPDDEAGARAHLQISDERMTEISKAAERMLREVTHASLSLPIPPATP